MNAELPSLFERPMPGSGGVYPCALCDLEGALTGIPRSDLAGLLAIGLVPSTAKDCHANARYFFTPRPEIHIYAYPTSLTIKLQPHLDQGRLENLYRVEREFGMEDVQVGSRWLGRWRADDLRRFILEHVLPHEIGHHVYHMQRKGQGLVHRPGTRESEQFAEAYARRLARLKCRDSG